MFKYIKVNREHNEYFIWTHELIWGGILIISNEVQGTVIY
jgi:hypothetical protein